jgi:hypothetical protein
MWKQCVTLGIALCVGLHGCSASLPRSQEPARGPFGGAGPAGQAVEQGETPWVFLGGLAAGLLVGGLWRWLALRRRLGRARAEAPGELALLRRALELMEEVHGRWRRSDKVVRLDDERRRRRPNDL